MRKTYFLIDLMLAFLLVLLLANASLVSAVLDVPPIVTYLDTDATQMAITPYGR